MNKLITHEVTDSIILISGGFVSSYLIKCRGGYIAIDAGARRKQVLAELAQWQIDPAQILAVFLTHTDSDHTAALGAFPRAEVFLAAAEEQMINGTTKRFLFMRNKNIPEYSLLADGAEKIVGEQRVQPLLTPGHTPGSTSYLVNGKYLFTGDTLALKDGQARLFTRLFSMNPKDQARSLRRLAALPEISYILTGHYGYTQDAPRAFAAWCVASEGKEVSSSG